MCPCYNCQGKELQLPRTRRDHSTRYPWPKQEPPTSPDRSPTPNDYSPLENSITLPHSPRPYSPPGQDVSPPRRPSPPIWRSCSEPPLDDDLLRTPSPGARRRARRQLSPASLPEIDPNDEHEHHFDELLPRRAFSDLDVDEELLDLEEDEQEEDELFDEFGQPRGPDEPPGKGQQPFQLPWENQAGEDPDPNPDDQIDPAEYCAAFQEHPLIRNAYIDAIVQKILFGASHNALNYQLKAVHRQLSSNPNVPAEDLARMALTIRTVERRLGLDSSDIIKTYTLSL